MVLTTSEYNRLRVGVGNEFQKGRQVDFVLGQWSAEEEKILQPRIEMAIEMVQAFATIGVQRAMSAYNNK